MSLPVPLSVTLDTGRGVRRITTQVHDLAFREVVPGGYASCTVALNRPLAVQPDEIDYFGRLVVHDTRNGQVVWDGWLEDPSRTAGPDGQVWQLTGIGPSAHASDIAVPLVYVERNFGRWKRQNLNTHTAARIDVSDSIDMSIPNGTSVVNGVFTMRADYQDLLGTGLTLGRLSIIWVATNNDTNNRFRILTRVGGGSATTVYDAGWTTTPTTVNAARGGSPAIPAGHDFPELVYERITSSGTAGHDYQRVTKVVLQQVRKDASGADITSGYTLDQVHHYKIVNDLLGRLLPRFDGPTASVEEFSALFLPDQMAYPDGATAAKVLDDLMLIYPYAYWAAWEQIDNGKHRFEWRQWPSIVRYEADVTDGYVSTRSGEDLYNAVRVRWREGDWVRSVRRTSSVAELDNAGRIREYTIDLGDEIGSQGAAETVGDQFLAEHGTPRGAAQLTIARPILDYQTGRMVQPWEIRAGQKIWLRGAHQPRNGAWLTTLPDGLNRFKIRGREYSVARGAATLDLDSYVPTVARQVAKLQLRPMTRRR